MQDLPHKDRAYFDRALQARSAVYSHEWKCPTAYLEKANYHTNLYCCDVHSTREAFMYANALLKSGEEADRLRAIDVLRHVAALQDKDPASATFGIWSWYMEEPLEKMSPPDWNWADFCGKEILQALACYAGRLPQDLIDLLRETLRCACLSIFRRNMHPGYTNISIMGSYVTLHAGQLLDWPEMFAYGRSRFEKSWAYTLANGTFAEYNSATYTTVAIEDLSRIHAHIEDAQVHRMAEDMLDVAWRTVAEHFHAPTRQWTGPNARSYTWLTSDATLSFLRNALDNGEALICDERYVYDPAWAYVDIRCPEKYRDAFVHCRPHDVNIGFTTGASIDSPRNAIAIAHITQAYTLSSWAVTSTWNQRRNLTGYWGGDKPRFINATILHNLYDFSSGMFVTAQKDGHALVAASMYTDGGDTHPSLDMIQNETITAYDLRVRIELGGALEKRPQVSGREAIIEDGGVRIRITLLEACFDGQPLSLTLSDTQEDIAQQQRYADQHRRFVGEEQRYYVDVVLYNGEEKALRLSELQNAYAVLCVSMEGEAPSRVQVEHADGMLCAKADIGGSALSVCAPPAPTPIALWHGVGAIDGVCMNEAYGLPELKPR